MYLLNIYLKINYFLSVFSFDSAVFAYYHERLVAFHKGVEFSVFKITTILYSYAEFTVKIYSRFVRKYHTVFQSDLPRGERVGNS